MPINRVGHVVLKVRDVEKAKKFYLDFLRMKVSMENPGKAIFMRFNDYHHDLAVFQVGPDADLPKDNQVGLVHVALVCNSDEEVRGYLDRAKAMGIDVRSTSDHDITHSLYLKDPEGNIIEIYAETDYDWPNLWRGPVAKPFDLEAVKPAPVV